MAGQLADLIVAIHVAYVSFIVVGQLAILVGWLRGWQWVRNPWFRTIHFILMAIVVFEVLMGIPCPLTVWEDELRQKAGQPISGESFIGRLLHNLIFIDLPPWGFTLLYLGFGGVILGSLLFCPPRRFRASASVPNLPAAAPPNAPAG